MNRGGEKKELTPEARKRRREVIIMIATAIVITILFYLEFQIFQLRDFFPFGLNLLFFGLINLNIIFIITLLFLILRNLAKLVFERRRDLFGARLRTKLVAAFSAFAVVPTVLFFLVTLTFITDSIERWFNVQVEHSLSQALQVAQTYYQSFEQTAQTQASQAAEMLAGSHLYEAKYGDDLALFLEGKERELHLGQISYHPMAQGSPIVSSGVRIPEQLQGNVPEALVQKGFAGELEGQIQSIGVAELVHGVAPVKSSGSDPQVVGVVVVTYFIPLSLVSKTHEIQTTFEEYKQLEFMKSPIKASYILFLVLISLLIFFSASWFGFYLARGLTQPIQKLAEGTQRVAGGDLDFRIPVEARDEFGQLVRSFNKMTSDLKSSKEETLQATIDLQEKNVEIDQRRRYTETVLGNIAGGVMSLNKDGVIETVNRSAGQMLRFTDPSPEGKLYSEVLESDQREIVEDLINEAAANVRDTVRRQEDLAVGDRTLTVFINCVRLTDEENQPVGYILMFDDLSELLRAQRVAAWQEVARRIAHEIKNPLTPIQLSAQRLQKRYTDRLADDGGVFNDCTRMIIQQVEEMKLLVNEFSKFARMAEIKPTPNDINEIIGEAILLYQEGHKTISFKLERDGSIPVFRFDRDQIKRVLINLLDNSVAAIQGEGVVVVTTRLNKNLNSVVVEIADNGCGIPNEYRKRLFEPYFSTKRKGTGLGLAIVSRIIQDHNGYIRIWKNKPEGTIISFELPLGVRRRARVA